MKIRIKFEDKYLNYDLNFVSLRNNESIFEYNDGVFTNFKGKNIYVKNGQLELRSSKSTKFEFFANKYTLGDMCLTYTNQGLKLLQIGGKNENQIFQIKNAEFLNPKPIPFEIPEVESEINMEKFNEAKEYLKSGKIKKIQNVNIASNKGKSLLGLAAEYGDINNLMLLITKGANLKHVTNKGHTILDLALRKKQIKMSIALFLYGLKSSLYPNLSSTNLHEILEISLEEFLQELNNIQATIFNSSY